MKAAAAGGVPGGFSMTFSKLLEELKRVDPETYEALRNYPIYVSGDEALSVDLPSSRNQTLVEDGLQGCLQRACEKRGWGLVVEWSKEGGPYEWSAYTGHEEPPGAFRAAYSWGIRKDGVRGQRIPTSSEVG